MHYWQTRMSLGLLYFSYSGFQSFSQIQFVEKVSLCYYHLFISRYITCQRVVTKSYDTITNDLIIKLRTHKNKDYLMCKSGSAQQIHHFSIGLTGTTSSINQNVDSPLHYINITISTNGKVQDLNTEMSLAIKYSLIRLSHLLRSSLDLFA